MKKVKITATTHPRLHVGYIYTCEEATGGVRYTSLGGKHSVFIPSYSGCTVIHETVQDFVVAQPRPFQNEAHVRIGERVAAQLWREEYLATDAAGADKATEAFLKRWRDGFFRGEAIA